MQKFYKIHRANGVFITQYVIVECVCLYVCVCVCVSLYMNRGTGYIARI